MHITIDNLDGRGAIDYSAAISGDVPFRIERVLNQPSRCTGSLLFGGNFMPGADPGLALPARHARVVVSSQAGAVPFTGYLATEPQQVPAGTGIGGPVYRAAFTAISDEWLLDKQATVLTASGFAADGATLLGALAQRTAAGTLSSPLGTTQPVGVFTPQPGVSFSTAAASIAAASYAGYRAVNGALALQPIGAATHTVDLDHPAPGEAIQPASLRTAMVRELANDVTLTGELEPAAYVTELFSGDGSTNTFRLSSSPFHPSSPTLLAESFDGADLNPQRWVLTDSGSHIALGSGGLALSGGTGSDGQTTLTAVTQVELGGTLVLEADGVQLTAPSAGILTGLYSDGVQQSSCIAGWSVVQSGGNTVLQPLIAGDTAGSSYILVARPSVHAPYPVTFL